MAVEVINTRYEILETLPVADTMPFLVHKSRDVSDGRTVALKVLPSRYASRDPNLMTRLRREINSSGSFEHPMVARTFEAAPLENGDVYLACDYLRGITLRERIRRVAPFSLAVASDIAATIAEALAAAHRAGVVHGRLLPRNVLLSPEGEIKVGDFGTWRVIADLLPDEAVAMAPFAAPEADPAKPATPSHDIYALGAILYEMLTGVLPTAQRGAMPASPRSLNPGIPPALEGITLKALHPDVSIRYRDAAVLLADLQAARAALRAGRSLNWSPLATSNGSETSPGDPEETAVAEPGDKRPRKKKGQRADRQYREPPSALGQAVLFFGIVAVIAAGVLFWKFNQFLSPPPDVTVPSLIGTTLDDAVRISHQRNFVLAQGPPDFSTKWPEGQVFSQDPAADVQVKAGSTVTVSVSEGPQFLTAPKIVGLTADKADRALHDATLQGAMSQDFSETVPKGVIISQTPDPGSNVHKYSTVTYVVSKGKHPPDLPINVQVNALGQDRVQITWQAANYAKTYRVTRIVNGTATDVAKALTATQFVDTGLLPDGTYEYTVTAANDIAESAATDPVSVQTPGPDTGGPAVTTPDASSNDDTTTTGSTDSSTPTSTTADTGSSEQRQFHVKFRLPSTPAGNHRVRIEVQDDTGTTLVADEDHNAGETIDVPVTAFGSKVIIRVFVDDTLMKQQTL